MTVKNPTIATWTTVSGAAERVNLDESTIRRMIARGALKAYRPAGTRSIRLKISDLDRAMKPIAAPDLGGDAA